MFFLNEFEPGKSAPKRLVDFITGTEVDPMKQSIGFIVILCTMAPNLCLANHRGSISFESFSNSFSEVETSIPRTSYNFRDGMDYQESSDHSGIKLEYSYDYGLNLFDIGISTESSISIGYGEQKKSLANYLQASFSQLLNFKIYNFTEESFLQFFGGPGLGTIYFVEDSEKVNGTFFDMTGGLNYTYNQYSFIFAFSRKYFNLKSDLVEVGSFRDIKDQKISIRGNSMSLGIGYNF
jgi:hypothetical protein